MGGKSSSPAKKFAQEVEGIRCGCYIRRPDQVGVNFDRALVPLRHIDYDLEVANSLLHITLKQIYKNPIDKFLEVDYAVPISPESSIYKFCVEFDNVKIEGIVKQKEQAKKQYEKAKSEGKQAAIGTIDPNSKDILNLEIGNIPPHKEFTVTISFLQQMKTTLNTFYQLHVPALISPRFMNKVEGVTKVTEQSVNRDKGVSSGKADYDWTFKISIRTSRKLVFFDSPSHSVTMISQNQLGTETVLVMDKSQVPNKDFVLVYTTENFYLPSSVIGSTDTSSTVMLSFIPKFCTMEITDAYKASIENKPFETDMAHAKGDYVFLLDRSGSMEGNRIQKAKQALVLFLKSLPQDSYFNVMSFGNNYNTLFDKSQRNQGDKIQSAIHQVQQMNADMGGTEIYDPLKKLLEQKGVEGYPRQVFLLTDGDVSNTEGVISMVRKNTKFCRVHSIGIGSGASIALIEGCAKEGKGKSIMISDDQNPAEKIIELLEATLTPLITKMTLFYDHEEQIESIVPNPKSIPYVLKDQIANFYITFKGPLKQKRTFTLEYEDSLNKLPYKVSLDVSPTDLNQPFVNKMSNLKVLRALENSANDGVQVQDQMYYVKVKDYKEQAIKYSTQHQVLSQFTAFLCVGKQLIDGQYQQFKNKGVHMVYVEQPKLKYYQQQQQMCARSMPLMAMYIPRSIQSQPAKKSAPLDLMAMQDECCVQSSPEMNILCDNLESEQLQEQPHIQNQMCIKSQMIDQIRNVKGDSDHMNLGDILQSKEYSKNKQSIPTKDKKQLSIKLEVDQIVKLQAVDGSWSNPALIDILSKNKKQVHELTNSTNSAVVITKLVVLWLQKYHPQKQYSLIVKKALAWMKKVMGQQGIAEEKLAIIESI